MALQANANTLNVPGEGTSRRMSSQEGTGSKGIPDAGGVIRDVPSKNRRRSSLAVEAGVSLESRDAELEYTKPEFLRTVANPILEAMAMK